MAKDNLPEHSIVENAHSMQDNQYHFANGIAHIYLPHATHNIQELQQQFPEYEHQLDNINTNTSPQSIEPHNDIVAIDHLIPDTHEEQFYHRTWNDEGYTHKIHTNIPTYQHNKINFHLPEDTSAVRLSSNIHVPGHQGQQEISIEHFPSRSAFEATIHQLTIQRGGIIRIEAHTNTHGWQDARVLHTSFTEQHANTIDQLPGNNDIDHQHDVIHQHELHHEVHALDNLTHQDIHPNQHDIHDQHIPIS